MADIFRTTVKKREAEAEDGTPPPKPLLPASAPKPPVDFIKGYTPEERQRQYDKLQETLRNRKFEPQP